MELPPVLTEEDDEIEESAEELAKKRHIESFVNSVKEYVELDDQLKAAQKDIRALKERKQNLSLGIMGFMNSQDWDVCNISTGGKLMLKKSKTKASIKQDSANSKLVEHFKDNKEVIEHLPMIMKMIFEDREINEKDVLRRTNARAKN